MNLFKALGPKTKRIIQSVVPEHQLTIDRIVKELDVQYAGSVEMRGELNCSATVSWLLKRLLPLKAIIS